MSTQCLSQMTINPNPCLVLVNTALIKQHRKKSSFKEPLFAGKVDPLGGIWQCIVTWSKTKLLVSKISNTSLHI